MDSFLVVAHFVRLGERSTYNYTCILEEEVSTC